MGCIMDSHKGQREAEMSVCVCVCVCVCVFERERQRERFIENTYVYYQERLSKRAGTLQERDRRF